MYNLVEGENSNLRDLSTFTTYILPACLLRFSEVSILKWDAINIQDAYMELYLEPSKTNICRTGKWTYIRQTNSVKITQKYILKAKILKGKSEYMFQGAVYRPWGINIPVTYSSARQDILNVLNKLGLSTEDYGLHSMRADACTMA